MIVREDASFPCLFCTKSLFCTKEDSSEIKKCKSFVYNYDCFGTLEIESYDQEDNILLEEVNKSLIEDEDNSWYEKIIRKSIEGENYRRYGI